MVEFIDGDPERPIITGSVYNADGGVPNLPFGAFKAGPRPFASDDLFAHAELSSFQRSGIKTSVSPPSSSGKHGFHLLRFDDTRGSEQLLMRSEGRYDLTAFHSHFETTHGDRHLLVQAGHDEKGKAFGGVRSPAQAVKRPPRRRRSLRRCGQGGAADSQGRRRLRSAELHVDRRQTASVNATKITLEAQSKITLRSGWRLRGGRPCGIFISGPMVQINSGGSPDSTSDADVTDPPMRRWPIPAIDNFLELQQKAAGGDAITRRTPARLRLHRECRRDDPGHEGHPRGQQGSPLCRYRHRPTLADEYDDEGPGPADRSG
jgi:type VI secretion system secreted protein VgrG